MSACGTKLRLAQGDIATFYCPGCKTLHGVKIAGVGAWSWNGSGDAPTFDPSVKVTSGHYVNDHRGGECWCTYNAAHPENPSGFECFCCHCFVRDGRIQFLSDCTHALAGQTVDLPDMP